MENLVYDLERAVWDKFRDESPTSAEPADFSYDEVAENVGARGEAILKKTVCYIVSAVVVHKDRVLMMKEAKKSCRGKWYLPAGRLERNESLEEGVIREVLEETGLYFQPSYLVCVDSQGTSWFRFTFAGSITGGELKRLEDKESLEAGWFTVPEISSSLQLRCRDILPLIDAGLKRYGAKQELVCKVLPTKKPHKRVILRFVIVKKVENSDSKSLDVLLLKKAGSNSPPCFPFAVSRSDGQNVASMIYSSIKKANKQAEYKVHGYLGVEHTGKPQGQADGLCLTVLVEMLSGSQQGKLSDEYEWFSVEQQGLTEKILRLMEVKGCIDWQFDF